MLENIRNLKLGKIFEFAGLEWVKLEDLEDGTLAITAKILEKRKFDEKGRDDWRVSSLRQHLNTTVFKELLKNGARRSDFVDIVSELNACYGNLNYGNSIDKIALLTRDQGEKYKHLIPGVSDWYYTLTPFNRYKDYTKKEVAIMLCEGGAHQHFAETELGIRPICKLELSVMVQI